MVVLLTAAAPTGTGKCPQHTLPCLVAPGSVSPTRAAAWWCRSLTAATAIQSTCQQALRIGYAYRSMVLLTFKSLTKQTMEHPITPPPTVEQLMVRIKDQQRQFGDCQYDWRSWKLAADSTRSTQRLCRHEIQEIVAVSCSSLKINNTEDGQWRQWRSPGHGEDLMVATLCSALVVQP